MGELDREMLLGYLMNALEDDETALVERELLRHPEYRELLAELEEEISPLAALYGNIDPPHNLAARTCSRIWALAEQEAELYDETEAPTIAGPHFGTDIFEQEVFRPEKTQCLEEILSVSPRESVEGVSPVKRLIRRAKVKRSRQAASKSEPGAPQKHRGRLFDLAASVAVGVLIAVIAFPAVHFARNRAQMLLTDLKLRNLNQQQSLEFFSPVSEASAMETAATTVSLNQSGWQEVNPNRLPFLLVADNARLNLSSSDDLPGLDPNTFTDFESISKSIPILTNSDRQRDSISSPGLSSTSVFSSVNRNSLSEPMIMTDVQQGSRTGLASTTQAVYGQSIVCRNGRVFFRVLPVFVAPVPNEIP